MGYKRVRLLVVVLTAFAILAGTATGSLAVNPPNWVAALFVEAQKTIGLRWTPVPGATTYKVLRSTAAGKDYKEIASVPTPQYFDKEVEPGTTYYYVLQAVAGAETSVSSPEKSVVIPGEKKVEEVKPPEWENLTVTAQTEFGKTNYKIGLFWKVSKGNIAAYNIYRSEAAGKDYALIASVRESQTIDVNVAEGKTYYYVITALDANTLMETPYSAEKVGKIEAVVIKKTDVKRQEKIIQRFRVSSHAWAVNKGAWGMLNGPFDVDVSDRELFVSNMPDKSIYVFDKKDGSYVRKFGPSSETEPNGLNDAKGIYYDPDEDQLFVAQSSGGKVAVFKAADGKWLYDIQVSRDHGTVYPGEDYQKVAAIPPAPADIALLSDGDTLVVVDNGRSKVLLYNKKGKFLKEITTGYGKGPPGSFSFPTRCTVNKSKEHRDDILVIDAFGTRVQVYDAAKEEWWAFGELGEVAGAFKTPTGIDVDPVKNVIFVADKDNYVVTEFNYQGIYQNMIGQKKLNESKNYLIPLGTPMGIRLDESSRRLFVANYYGGFVYAVNMSEEIFTPEGQ